MERVKKDKLPKSMLWALESLMLYGVTDKDRQSGSDSKELIMTTKEFREFMSKFKKEIIEKYKIDKEDLGKIERINSKELGDFFYKKILRIVDDKITIEDFPKQTPYDLAKLVIYGEILKDKTKEDSETITLTTEAFFNLKEKIVTDIKQKIEDYKKNIKDEKNF